MGGRARVCRGSLEGPRVGPAAFGWPLGLLGFLWGAHAVHHHGEDFNITVSTREPFVGIFMLAPFFLPPAVYLVGVAMHVFFGYLEHTQFVDRLPRPFEWLFATPSNHRVHHAINPEYLDRNYGAILMIWDRMFGTYEPERAPCVFGVTKPLTSLNPVWANLEHWGRITREARAAKGLRARLRIVFGPPVHATETREAARLDQTPPLPLGRKLWISSQLVVVSMDPEAARGRGVDRATSAQPPAARGTLLREREGSADGADAGRRS